MNFIELLRDRVVHRSQVGKRKLDALLTRRELDRKWHALGERVSGLAAAGRIKLPVELADLLGEARELEERLKAQQREIADLEGEIPTQS